MSEQNDAYSLYEAGTCELLNRMGRDHPLYSEGLVYQQRLTENIAQSRQYGDTPTRKADRAEIVRRLNELSRRELDISLGELCDQITYPAIQELDQHSLLELARRSPGEPVSELVCLLLKDLCDACRDDDWEKIQDRYQDILECHDSTGTGLAQLYLADAHDRNNDPTEGTRLARRAIDNFHLAGDHCKEIVAHLFLAHLKQELEAFGEAETLYRKADVICKKQTLIAKENAQSEENAIIRQIRKEMQRGEQDLGKAERDRLTRRCFLNPMKPIPVLQPGDRPDMIREPSRMIACVATDVFKINERPYFLYSLDDTGERTLKLNADALHFAFPVPEDGWLDTDSKRGDYALVQRETRISYEGPGLSWTERHFAGGRFKRDPATGEIHFEPPQSHIIGRGYIIALFKPKPTR
jgi:hypothetical protein